jgi:hypothetical protein
MMKAFSMAHIAGDHVAWVVPQRIFFIAVMAAFSSAVAAICSEAFVAAVWALLF